jgi:hypothetical protein
MSAKIGKTEARYQDHPKGTQWCARCSMFREPHGCTLVTGRIDTKGWCKYFEVQK